MKKNKFKYLIKKAIISVIIIVAVGIWHKSLKPSAIHSDIEVEAILELNNTDINNYNEYVLYIKMTKNKDCNVAIYPYVEGTGNMNFGNVDMKEYYIPGSIGSDGVTEAIAITDLENNNLIDIGEDISLYGFCFPDKAGEYKTKTYLDKFDIFKKIKNPVLVCVYTENKYGKELTWSKIVPIIIK